MRSKKEILETALDVAGLVGLIVGVTVALKIPADVTVEIPANVLILLAFTSVILLDRFRMSIHHLEKVLFRLEKSDGGEESESGMADDSSRSTHIIY